MNSRLLSAAAPLTSSARLLEERDQYVGFSSILELKTYMYVIIYSMCHALAYVWAHVKAHLSVRIPIYIHTYIHSHIYI